MDEEKVICDTDVMIDYWGSTKSRHQSTIQLLENEIGLDNVLISAITKMELLMGATNKADLTKINNRLRRFTVVLITEETTLIAFDILQKYRLSHGLAMPDAIIAATSLKMKLKLLTYNTKDYKFIDKLQLYKL